MSAAQRIARDSQHNTKIALLEQSDLHLIEVIEKLEKRFEKLEERIETVFQKIESGNRWLIGIIISVLFSASTLLISVYSAFK